MANMLYPLQKGQDPPSLKKRGGIMGFLKIDVLSFSAITPESTDLAW